LRTTSIDQALSSTKELELGTLEPYHKSSICTINPESIVTVEDITALHRYKYGENIISNTPLEKRNSIWYTQYPPKKGNSSQNFEIPVVWGGDKT